MSLPSNQPALPLPPYASAPSWWGARTLGEAAAPAPRVNRLTLSGIYFFLVTLLIPLSARTAYRIQLGGLGVHPYLVLMLPLLIHVVVFRLRQFPQRTLAAMVVFTVMFGFATLGAGGAAQETVKIGASVAAVITAALAVRSDQDFRLAVLGLILGVVYLTSIGIVRGAVGFTGVDPLEGTNENAFSLYTLAPMLLAGYICMDDKAPKWMRVILGLGLLVLAVGTFSSANRSGWLGAAVVALLLLWRGRGLRTVLFVGTMVTLAYFAFLSYGKRDVFELRYQETISGRTSDIERWHIVLATIRIGLANPILGVSPQNLKFDIGREIGLNEYRDAHNVFGHLLGGTGLITFGCLLYMGWTLFQRPPGVARAKPAPRQPQSKTITPHRLLRMMLILWVVRGMFSSEILVAPNFCIGLGLTIGLCIAYDLWHTLPRSQASPARPQLAPVPA
jgi:hypothetical protein